MDLLSYVDFDLEKAKRDSLALNKNLKIFEVSCKTAAGLDGWIAWLTQRIDEFKKSRV
jgi:hydrogenase nickel incorporation protein HypB